MASPQADQRSALMRGVAAARAGDTHEARRLLSEAVRENPASAVAWLWLAGALDTVQGRRHCLNQVLALDPTNQAAQRGLAALEMARAERVVVAQPAAAIALPPRPAGARAARPGSEIATAAPHARSAGRAAAAGAALRVAATGAVARVAAAGSGVRAALAPAGSRLTELAQQPRFWRAVVAALGAVALVLVAALVYIATSTSPASPSLAAAPPFAGATDVLIRAPVRTLRPTFTPVPTSTPTWTPSPSPSPLPPMLPTYSPTPPPTDTPTPTPTRSLPKVAARIALPTAAPRPTLPPLRWDPRLDELRIALHPAPVQPGEWYWRLVEARWTDGKESGGKHTIYVEVLDVNGHRVVGQPVVFEWSGGSVVLPIEDRPPPDWGANFAMYAALGSYAASIGGGPTDIVSGMGMGEPQAREVTIHTCFYLTFRRVQR